MNIPALAGTAVGSVLVGALAGGWLVMLTPLPAYVVQPARAALSPRLEPTALVAEPAAPAPTILAPTILAPAMTPSPAAARSQASPARSARPAAPPAASRVAVAPPVSVRHRLAKVAAMLLPGRPPLPSHPSPRGAAPGAHLAGALTPSEIGRIRASLRLSPEQEAQWSPVAEMLRQVGRRQMAALRNGEEFSFASSGDLMHFYLTAQPLLRNLREDQKVEVRALARRMGFGSYASYI